MLHSYLEVDRKYIANLQKNWFSLIKQKIYDLLSLLVPAKYLSLLSTSLQNLQKENKKGGEGEWREVNREERKRGRQENVKKRPEDLFKRLLS